VFQEGNRNLDSEKANTWTAGLVFTSRSGNPWLAGLSGAVDWWKVDIKDAIQQYSIDYAQYLCYGVTSVADPAAAAAQAATDACQSVGRNQSTGGATTMLLKYDNQATIKTSGLDLALNWFGNFAELGAGIPGGLGLTMQATVLDYYKTKQSPYAFDVETDWKGSLGPTLTGTNGGAYDFRLNTSLNYILNNKSFGLRWRYLPSVESAAKATENAIIANNERVAAGGEGVILSYTPSTALKAKDYSVLDFSFSWSINDTLSLRAGIDNLLDTQPAITGATAGRPSGNLSEVCSAAQEAKGCVDPSSYSLASSGAGSTSPGYYDVLGRRYYLGLKAKF
jgi:outer membrane receptor protein involved in Fe transport